MLNIILTSYNRPKLIRRTLESLAKQTSNDWRCVIQDDNSGPETLAVLDEYEKLSPRFVVLNHATTDEQRKSSTRYSALINEVLPELSSGIVGYLCDNVEYRPELSSGIVGYLCDNVEYRPELVADVMAFFDHNPDVFAGYVLHLRDVYRREGLDGVEFLGSAVQHGHWDITPPSLGIFSGDVRGWFDHSQVFHRLPCAVRWNEDASMKGGGDGDFFTRLIDAHGPLYPINAGAIRTLEHLLK